MRTIAALLGTLILALAACGSPEATPPEPTPGASPTPDESPVGTPTPDETPMETRGATPTASPDDEPDELPAFACDALPFEDEGTVALVNIADVRVGQHDGFDRLVFEFQAYADVNGTGDRQEGIPEHLLRAADPPLVDNPRGAEMDVAGDAFLHLTLLGGTRLTAEFEETFEGPLQFDVNGEAIAEVVEAGDFEATADWYIGLEEGDPCLRVFELDDPARLVIDIEHP
jgi:hypothetical protein